MTANLKSFLFLLFSICAPALFCSDNETEPSVPGSLEIHISKCDVSKTVIDWNAKGVKKIATLTLYRSILNLEKLDIFDLNKMPITVFSFKPDSTEGVLRDSSIAHNCTYFYYLEALDSDSNTVCSNYISCTTDAVELLVPPGSSTTLYIDKINYFLEVRLGNESIKRYPVSLGGNPKKRKLHYDCLTTPEGNYKINYINLNSSFYKSFKINYPNKEDRRKYHLAKKNGSLPLTDSNKPVKIGGDITIHGGGIGLNWTWGCIAMRNRDIDELLNSKAVTTGTEVLIIGSDIKKNNL